MTAAQAAGPIWLKLSKSGNTYTGQYKFTETGEWQNFSGTVTNAMAAPKFGLYTQGVLQENDTVTFEYFSVDGDSTGCPPTDENEPPTIESVTATPTSGFAPLSVKFDVTASDEDDDDAHVRVGLRRQRLDGLDVRGSDAHLHRGRHVRGQGDRVRR